MHKRRIKKIFKNVANRVNSTYSKKWLIIVDQLKNHQTPGEQTPLYTHVVTYRFCGFATTHVIGYLDWLLPLALAGL